jgi:hypothetical protein
LAFTELESWLVVWFSFLPIPFQRTKTTIVADDGQSKKAMPHVQALYEAAAARKAAGAPSTLTLVDLARMRIILPLE